MTVIVTGAAGFIGFHVCNALIARGENVVGIDNLNSYYSVALKKRRLEMLGGHNNFRFEHLELSDAAATAEAFAKVADASTIVHLAAQAGVRYSFENPLAYVNSNLVGQVTVLEAARRLPGLQHVVYASSSSVYGGNTKLPFSIDDEVDQPLSLYAATKRADELITYSYASMHGLAATGLRFFSVYGPWGRPDMAAYLFADAIVAGKPIRVFNGGQMERDFTYIDDIVGGILAAADRPAAPNSRGTRHAVYNLGNNHSVSLLRFIEVIEQSLGLQASKLLEPMQQGDVRATIADIEASRRDLGFAPTITIDVGVPRFIDWYKSYHGLR
jgi:UDP-glucuronate 4-epimerase